MYLQTIIDVCSELLAKDKDHSDKKYDNCKVNVFMAFFAARVIFFFKHAAWCLSIVLNTI